MQDHQHQGQESNAHYTMFGIMLLLNFVAMYALMYAMVDVFGNVYNSINQLYMAGLMTALMMVFEVLLMRGMYSNRRLNMLIVAAGIVAGALFFFGIRMQTAIGDEQFLRSMIPHHAGAVLMCGEATLADPEIKALCEGIIAGQQAEIDWMRTKLEALQAGQ